jgi:hypothetical protein
VRWSETLAAGLPLRMGQSVAEHARPVALDS